MSEPSTEGNNKKHSKPTLPISIGAGFAALCNLSSNDTFKQAAAIFAPAVGWFVSILVRWGINEINRLRFERIVRGWIRDLEKERDLPGTNQKRRREIETEISGHRKKIRQHQLENFKINYL